MEIHHKHGTARRRVRGNRMDVMELLNWFQIVPVLRADFSGAHRYISILVCPQKASKNQPPLPVRTYQALPDWAHGVKQISMFNIRQRSIRRTLSTLGLC